MDIFFFFFFQAEDGIRDADVTGVQTCALPISPSSNWPSVLENSAVPAVAWVTDTAGTEGEILVARARPAPKLGAACCATANRAAPSRAACRATAPRTVSPSRWEDWSGRAR